MNELHEKLSAAFDLITEAPDYCRARSSDYEIFLEGARIALTLLKEECEKIEARIVEARKTRPGEQLSGVVLREIYALIEEMIVKNGD